ncbi:hypothetical protein SAMN05421743_12125 [Thalassobacillus cyri]|uniref:Uncharacterized protein n=1 Tax=Thalassobacillus cyri TaxID=571932 RepID=A0A1H4H3E1_9BACI|nr:hypothetical protein [Thalassobacillus cyri]SEB15628.1 hypothetical protein SAMN05421743_12125 [Thalassobacillus cyri]
MKKPVDHEYFKLIGTSKFNDKIIMYVLYKTNGFFLDHIIYDSEWSNVHNEELLSYLSKMKENIVNGTFDDHQTNRLRILDVLNIQLR